ETVESLTGDAGRHLFFRHPGGRVANAVGRGRAFGIDLRADDGYVVVPPSWHERGRRYCWRLGYEPETLALAMLPAWLLMMLGQTVRPTLQPCPVRVPRGEPGAAVGAIRLPTVIADGTRNLTLFRHGAYLRR